ncbi:MAG: ABC transporter ATP-binding protein [Rickettsiales bacterium]|jgi:lipoprotein-releasing system ATP-binding protein|nr:ABC transporter ATP-binding protein [Rickettsiales bacterium]
MSNILELRGIHKSFGKGESKATILDNASLELKQGEAVALTGPSGSGKSTLLYIAGLLDNADKGDIIIDGADCAKLDDTARTLLRREKLGFVYQQHNLFADFTALENVAIPLMIAGRPHEEARATAAKYLKKLGLSHRENGRATELSGGEAQRVAIARALVLKPKILLADEPTGNLDPKNSEHVFEMLISLANEEGMAALVATHNPTLAKRLARQVSVINGRLSAAKQ